MPEKTTSDYQGGPKTTPGDRAGGRNVHQEKEEESAEKAKEKVSRKVRSWDFPVTQRDKQFRLNTDLRGGSFGANPPLAHGWLRKPTKRRMPKWKRCANEG